MPKTEQEEGRKLGKGKKLNQRLFKRLILYYNVGCTPLEAAGNIFTKADSAPPGSRLMTVAGLFAGATRAPPVRRRGPSAASPLGVDERGTGPLATLTDAGRNLYRA